jgi:hypothetical protein
MEIRKREIHAKENFKKFLFTLEIRKRETHSKKNHPQLQAQHVKGPKQDEPFAPFDVTPPNSARPLPSARSPVFDYRAGEAVQRQSHAAASE